MEALEEGRAKIHVGKGVFYNPAMKGLRDISVSFVKAAGRGRLLDSTAASGVRAIRYALEAGISDAVLIDMNDAACRSARRNVALNGLRFEVYNTSIQEFAGSKPGRFGIVDLDPFGSPAPQLFDLMKLCEDGTLIMATATDMAVLCGAHFKACIKIYSARPLHNEMCKEAGTRILLGYAARIAAQYNFGITPLLCVSDMHYVRVFMRMDQGAAKALESVSSSGIGGFCRSCYSFTFGKGPAPLVSEKCSACAKRLEAFGPLWLGKLYDKRLVSKIAADSGIRIINAIKDELDIPMFYSIPRITKMLGIGSVSHAKVIMRLRDLGYKATPTQFDKYGVKTDAGPDAVICAVKELYGKG